MANAAIECLAEVRAAINLSLVNDGKYLRAWNVSDETEKRFLATRAGICTREESKRYGAMRWQHIPEEDRAELVRIMGRRFVIYGRD